MPHKKAGGGGEMKLNKTKCHNRGEGLKSAK